MKNATIQSLRLEQLSFAFAGRDAILENVTADLPTDKIVWVKGPSGAGKSVLIKLLNALCAPTSGRYLLNGMNVHEMSFEEFLPYRLQIGYSFDFGGLINNRTIYQNLSLPLEYHQFMSAEEIHNRVEEYLDYFNLSEVRGDRPSSVPGAFRKAVCVARAFLMAPQVLLLDDPTTGLRSELRLKLKKLLVQKKNDGELRHIFVATDDNDFIEDIADAKLLVENKSLQLLGQGQEDAA